jgi:cation diffusion facilitator CzcD-associated flavoprotein CzcO
LFKVLREGKASVVIDHVQTFTERGIALKSGRELEADIVVAATAAALAHLGKLDEARPAVKEGLALDPTFTIRRLKSATVSDNPTFREQGRRVIQGMRIAKVPEG